MDAATASVIAAVISAAASIVAAVITTRSRIDVPRIDGPPSTPARDPTIDQGSPAQASSPQSAKWYRILAWVLFGLLWFIAMYFIIFGLVGFVSSFASGTIDNLWAPLLFLVPGVTLFFISQWIRKRLQRQSGIGYLTRTRWWSTPPHSN
jgi:hypothetical protein